MRAYDLDSAKLRLFYSGHPVWKQKPGIARTGASALKKIGFWTMCGFIGWAVVYFLAHTILWAIR